MEALLSNFNNMEMKSGEMSESEIQQKSELDANQNHMENDVNQEKQADKIPGSEVDLEPVEKCKEPVVETDVNPDKQADPKAMPGVNKKPIETRQETDVETDVTPEKQISDPGVIYRCRRCRQMVATQEYVVTHKVGQGDGNFGTRKKSHVGDDDKKPECSLCIFVEPMKWMKAVEEGYISHKLYCMGCKALLGQFNWAGMQCTCGTWVIPAFQLTKSKIDQCSM